VSRRELRRTLWRVDAAGLKLEWRREGDDVECRVRGRYDVAGFGATWASALGDLLARLGV
jgi:hypothetical protein